MGILDNLEASMEKADLLQSKKDETVDYKVEDITKTPQGLLPCPYCGGDGVLWVPSHNDPNRPEQEQCFSCDANGMVEVNETIWKYEPF